MLCIASAAVNRRCENTLKVFIIWLKHSVKYAYKRDMRTDMRIHTQTHTPAFVCIYTQAYISVSRRERKVLIWLNIVQKNELRGEALELLIPIYIALITGKLSPAEWATRGIVNSLQINIFSIISVPWLGRFRWGFSCVMAAGSRAGAAASVSAGEPSQRVTLYSGQNY